MSSKSPANVAASVRQHLLNRARKDNRTFDELLQYYAMERFLYRLSQSVHADRFVLKGALMLRVWRASEFRPTMDIDMLGRTSNEEASVKAQVCDILALDAEPDGLVFDPSSIQTESITEDADYQGIRIRFRGSLDSARVNMQIDIGFGDVVFPEPEKAELPTLLELPKPRLLCYSRESAIAEKFEAMVKLGELNSRMKDFYDIWHLSRQFDFDGKRLAEAIRLTFDHRGTAIPLEIVAFSDNFINAKQSQWAAFRKKLKQDHVPESFREVVVGVKEFLAPIVRTPSIGVAFASNWLAPGPWS